MPLRSYYPKHCAPRSRAAGPLAAFLVACALVAFAPRRAGAVTFTVNSTADEADAAPGDGVCAAADGACTLRAAIQEAGKNAPGCPAVFEIVVPAGTYVLSLEGEDDDGAVGDLDISGTGTITITGAGAASTIIDGNNIDRIFDIHQSLGACSGSVTISGVTLTNGNSTGGAAVNAGRAAVTIDRCTLTHNTGDAAIQGGTSGSMTIKNTHIVNTTGRGISCLGFHLTVQDSTIADNTSAGDGAGVSAEVDFQSTFHNVVIARNHSTGSGGGISCSTSCAIEDSQLLDNTATTGGAVNEGLYDIRITSTTLSGNTASGDGGAVNSASDVYIANSTLTLNYAGGDGGAVAMQRLENLTIENSTISGNHAGGDGGGIAHLFSASSCVRTLRNVTLVNNTAAGQGGGLFVDPSKVAALGECGPLSVVNSIFANNSAGDDATAECGGEIDGTFAYTLITAPGSCASSLTGAGNIVGQEPLLGDLAANGGPTQTHALLVGSPAIDAGDPAGCTDENGDALVTDQRGVTRPQFGRCDIGAYEFACGNGVVDLGEDCDNGNTLDGDCCSATCHFETTGSTCASDGNPCTEDACDGAGACTHSPENAACPVCEACNVALGCIAAPRIDCREPAAPLAAQLLIARGKAAKNDHLAWSYLKGQATTAADFGDPTTADGFGFCVYDESQAGTPVVARAEIPAGDACGKHACWKGFGNPPGAKGFLRNAREGTPDGITRVLLKPGSDRKASIVVEGKGERLLTPNLPLNLPLLVQLQSDAGGCWEARYGAAGVKRNDTKAFKGKAP